MTPVAPGFDLWQPEDTGTLIGYVIAGLAIIVAGCLAERSRTWHNRYCSKAAENAELRLLLAAPRNQPGARPRPRELHEWPEPTPPARERHWTSTLWWPGCRGSALPLEYGIAPLDGSRLDDRCLRTPAPTDAEVLAWRLEDQPRSWPLDAVDIAVAWFADEIEAANTHQMETLDA